MNKSGALIFFIAVLVFCPLYASDAQDEDFVRTYIDLPIEIHLQAAEIKIRQMTQSQTQSGDFDARKQLLESQKLLQEALKKYVYYLTQDEVLMTDNWRSYFNSISQPGFPDIGQSPLSLLAHVYIAYEAMMQSSANIMIQPIQYTEEEIRLHKILDEAEESTKKALQAAQAAVGRVVYGTDTRIFIEIPSDYNRLPSSRNMPIQTRKEFPDGSPQCVVSVKIFDAEHTIAPETYVRTRIAALRKKFPDFADSRIEEARGDGYEVRALFSYTYIWEGDKIKALVFVHKSGQRAHEVSCLALADHFDRVEFEQIIRSFHRL
jgi:hypothetical protein